MQQEDGGINENLYRVLWFIVLQYVTGRCSVLQCVALCCNVLQCVARCCSVSEVIFLVVYEVAICMMQLLKEGEQLLQSERRGTPIIKR